MKITTRKAPKIKTRRYAPKDSKLSARYIDQETGDLIELYAVSDTVIVRIPKDELSIAEYWKPKNRRKKHA
jgi:hypothetical protein